MGWSPIKITFKKVRYRIPSEAAETTPFAKPTLDLSTLPQLMNARAALQITNYVVSTDGGLQKRGGLSNIFTVAGVNPVTMLFEFTPTPTGNSNIWLFGYGTTVAAYDLTTQAVTNIKTDFKSSAIGFTGVRYGDYAFVCNNTEAIGRISRTLAYDIETSAFTTGLIVTGQTSGATAVILEIADSTPTGTLTLGNIVGTFQDDEIIKDSSTGSATANGVVTWAYTTVSGAPTCGVLATAGGRLYAGNLSDDSAGVRYSDQDSGGNPPFSNWTTGTGGADPGKVFYRNAGTVRAINFLGDNIVVLSDEGKWAFQITTNNTSGTLLKDDVFILQRRDMGGCRASIVTPKGMFYANRGGFWQLKSLGQSNVPFSEQESDPALLLGTTYFTDVDFTNADMAYNAQLDTLFLTIGKNSNINNYVVCINLSTGTMSELTGWNINRFMNIDQTIYGGSAAFTKVYKCFDGSDDDGMDIFTYFYQELQTGGLETRKSLLGQYMDAFVVPNVPLNVTFDIYDAQGNFIPNKLGMTFMATSAPGGSDGYGQAAYGSSAFGGSEQLPGVVEYFDGARGFIRNYQRVRIKISAADKSPHKLIWIKLNSQEKVSIRKRGMQITT